MLWFVAGASAPVRDAASWFPVVVAVLFGASVIAVFHVEFRKEAFSFSLSELPIVLTIVFLTPTVGTLARIVGALVALLLIRKPPRYKLFFNLGTFTAEMAVAYAIMFALLGSETPSDTKIVVVASFATFVASVAGSVAVSIAISRFEGDTLRRVVDELKSAWILIVNATAAAMILGLALREPLIAAIAIVPVSALWVLVQRHGEIAQQLRDLDEVHGFTSSIGTSLGIDEVSTTAVQEAARILRAEVAILRITEADNSTRIFTSAPDDKRWNIAVDDPWWDRIASDPETRSLAVNQLPVGSRQEVGGERHLIVSPVADHAGSLGTLIIAGPRGAERHFDGRRVSHVRNLTEQLATNLRKSILHAQVEYEARHDTLTGLPNRNAFEGHVSAQVRNTVDRSGAYVLMLDLDRFKEVNDTLGHHAGDDLLIEFSRRVSAEMGEGELFARLAGDEFAMYVPRSTDADITALAARCVAAASRPIILDGLSVVVTASVGIAELVDTDTNAVGPIRRADVAMYNAKSHHLGIELYRVELDRRTPARLSMLGDLRDAIEGEQLGVEFQPKLDLKTGMITGAEALVRWEHPVRGNVPPTDFIRVAEETGLIKQLTDLMLAKGISTLREFHEWGYMLGLSVNLSTHDLVDAQLPSRVQGYLDANGVEPGALTLEITESSLLIDGPRARVTIDELDAMGVRMAIDDFGTGYSSLSYLRQLPVRELKIDQSFVTNLLIDEQDEVIVRSTIDLGHNLGLEVVAEGVESEPVLERLKTFGCDVAQGFCISRPLSSSLFLSWLATTDHPSRRNEPSDPAAWIEEIEPIAETKPDDRR